MNETLHSEVTDGICTLTIDNQEKRNALSPPILSAIIEQLDVLEDRDDVQVLIFTGAGEKSFSSGYDISELDPDDYYDETRIIYNQVINKIYKHPYPTIAMINGHVFGGAMALISACDLRVAVEDALFAIPPAKLGLIYGDQGINYVMNHLGPANTKELLFTGEPIDAQRANEDGLLNHAEERENLEEKTYKIAEQIASNAPLSLEGMKLIVRALLEKRTLTDIEKEWFDKMRAEAAQSRDHREGLDAFDDNREPDFEGK